MKQTEITVQVFENIDVVRKKLELAGYKLTAIISGEDSYYTNISRDQLKTIKYDFLLKNSVIIRKFNNITNNSVSTKLIYKDKTVDKHNIVLNEEKFETMIDNPKSCEIILEKLGLYNYINLKQKNYFYKLNDREITIGTVDGISSLVMEIEEYPEITDYSPFQKIEKLKNLAQSFEFNLGDDFSFKKMFSLFEIENNNSK